MSETWRGAPDNAVVRERIAMLRASTVGPYVTQAKHEGRGFFASRVTTEITYPAGIAVPAIEIC